MALADPTQFAQTPNAALASAAQRRLSQPQPTYNAASPMFTDQPAAHQPPIATQPNIPVNTITHDKIPVGGMAPPANPNNPLSGGTGNAGLDAWLGTDSTYESQLSDLMRNFDQYNAQKNLTASQTQADYDAKQRSLRDQSTKDQLNMRNAAAAQGILYSGIYANELGQYNTANQQQLTNLLGGLQNSKDSANLAYNQFVANEIASKEQAIQQAAARRAAMMGTIQ